MKRGEIYYANLDPTVGSEVNKRRPVLLVSNNVNNRANTLVTVLPITSSIDRVYPFEVLLPAAESGLMKDSKAQAQQIRTLSKQRLIGKMLGQLTAEKMQAIDTAMRLHLNL
jgi:mRNA interferase MazF